MPRWVVLYLSMILIYSVQSASPDDADLILESVTSFDTENVDLGDPSYVDLGPDGSLYVLDVLSRKIHIWNPDGSYKKSFGREGRGPGELEFESPEGEMAVFNGKIIIVEEASARIHYFDLNTLEHQRTISRPKGVYRVHLIHSDEALFALNVSGGKRSQTFVQLSEDFEVVREIISRPNERFEWLDGGKFIIRPYANRIKFSVNKKHLFLGETRDNLIRIHSHQGEFLKSFRVPLVQDDLTPQDKLFFRQRSFNAGNQDVAIFSFPKKNNFFEQILALDDQVLIFKAVEGVTRFEGVAYDMRFKRIGSFTTPTKSWEYMVNLRDRIFSIATDEEGDYQLEFHQLKPVAKH